MAIIIIVVESRSHKNLITAIEFGIISIAFTITTRSIIFML